MKLLSGEVKNLLDKLYNLRSDDSTVLTKINEERQQAIETQERTKNEKEVLIKEIEKLSEEESLLAEQGNKLMELLNSINKADFSLVLERLDIDFEPDSINSKVHKLLPETIENVVLENKKATEKLESVEEEMNNSITLVEELGLRKDEAISNQSKLNEYFDMALHGNINITRDEITNLLAKFDFSQDEQREAAKILMFPEDALYEYDMSVKNGENTTGKSMADVILEAKATVDEVVDEPKKEKEVEEKEKLTEEKTDNVEETKPLFEEDIIDIVEDAFKTIDEETKEETENNGSKKEELLKLLNSVGIDENTFDANELATLLDKFDEVTLKENVEVLKSNGLDLKILKNNSKILYDKELKEKINALIEIGKEIDDICLTPSILTKYDLNGLTNTINVLQISGLDPKKVPLMAF